MGDQSTSMQPLVVPQGLLGVETFPAPLADLRFLTFTGKSIILAFRGFSLYNCGFFANGKSFIFKNLLLPAASVHNCNG